LHYCFDNEEMTFNIALLATQAEKEKWQKERDGLLSNIDRYSALCMMPVYDLADETALCTFKQ